MAWKMPPLRVRIGQLKEPRSLDGTMSPSTSTVTTMMTMPISASVLALASYTVEKGQPSSEGVSKTHVGSRCLLTLAMSLYSVSG